MMNFTKDGGGIFILQTILIIFETLKNNQKIFNINLIIQIIIIIPILFLDKGSSSQGFIFIILGYSVIVFNTKISIGILGISYLVYSLSRYYVGYNHSQYGITYERLINFGINLVFMYIMFFLAKHEITQKEIIKENCPNTIVIILTTFDEDNYIVDSLLNGASGYLLKDIEGDKLIATIREAYNGNMILPSNIATKIVEGLYRKNQVLQEEKKIVEDLNHHLRCCILTTSEGINV